MSLLAYSEHRAGRMAHDPFRRAPKQNVFQAGVTVGGQNNQIYVLDAGDFADLRMRPTQAYDDFSGDTLADPRAAEVFGPPRQDPDSYRPEREEQPYSFRDKPPAQRYAPE